MFPFAERAQAFLRVTPAGGLVLVPVRGFNKEALSTLLRLQRRDAVGRLFTTDGEYVTAGPAGFGLTRRRGPNVLRFEVTETGDGAVLLALDGAFLRADAAGRVKAEGGSAEGALRFRLIGEGAAFGQVEPRLTRKWGEPRQAGRLARFPHRTAPGIGQLRDARVIALDWLALMPGGTRHGQPTAHARRRGPRTVLAYPLPLPGRLETAGLLGGYYNYYHHLVDYMVNWFDLRDRIAEDVPLLTLPASQRFQVEILEAFGIAHRAVPVPPLAVQRVRRLFVPRSAVVSKGEVREMRVIEACRAFLDTRIAPQADAPRRIFVSRDAAPTRRAPNEAEAIAIAERHGFTAIRLETLSFLEQVALFRRAEAVAGLHGAGFANLIFAPPGCRVIEIMPTDKEPPPFFANLATGLGQPFARVDARGDFHAMDLEIDLPAFAAALPD